jgi:dihydroxy-acid dehydratase
MALPGSAAIPAVHSARLLAAEASGRAAMALVGNPMKPSQVITEKSIENALRIIMAVGGSTNAVIHLTAIAGRAGVKISYDRLNVISDETPVLVDLKPVGEGYMEDFFAAGGVGAVLRELKPLLHLDTLDVEGRTLDERLSEKLDWVDRKVIREFASPVSKVGGLIALRGNLAPDGAIFKRAAATESLFEHEGRAVVFESLEDLAGRIDDPALDVEANDVLVLQNAGPKAASMPEAGYLPIPRKLAQQGVKDMLRISDARMSGTAFGTVVLHVAPESAVGGPLGAVRSGDRIRLSVAGKTIELLVDAAELKKRLAGHVQPAVPSRGYAALYQKTVTQAPDGCDFDFLAGK